MADLDGDGIRDLLVGQFAEGKIAFYRGLGKGRFGRRAWVTAGGETVRVPGVW
ncbi:MAG: VCBS repeat-containing protein [Planctomycetota bacterium]